MTNKITTFDTTLRDGAQREGISLSVDDKLHIAARLDELGVDYIEAGFVGAHPKDEAFFEALAGKEKQLKHAQLVAFGVLPTHKGVFARDDVNLQKLAHCPASIITLAGATWDQQVKLELETSPDENLRMIYDSIHFLRNAGKRVFFNAEHFFDGCKANADYMFEVIAAALQGGAETIVLCDTNGGCLPNEIFSLTWQIVQALHVTGQEVPIGIRACNDSACAVANSLEAVRAGATLVQGTVNGYGERAGACNLLSLIANLQLKLGYQLISSEQLSQLTQTAQFVAETFNVALDVGTPYVGKSAFACKGGRHVGAEMRSQGIHAHVDPASVGNFAHVVLSDLTSKAALFAKSQGYGFSLKSVAALDSLFECINQREAAGYSYEVADASLELLLKTQLNEPVRHFTLESFRVISEHHAHGESTTEATVKVHVNTKVGPVRFIATSEGNDPVRALDAALRKAITRFYPQVTKFELCDYKVRLIDGGAGTGATMRALIETTDGQHNWSTVGVSENLIEASWDALVDSIAYGLLKGAAR